jgi:hypothetical protein
LHRSSIKQVIYSFFIHNDVNTKSIRKKPSTIRYNDGTLHFSGLPIQEDLNANPSYWKEDQTRRVEEPFVLKTFLDENQDKITASNETDLFDSTIYKSDVKLLGHGQGIKCTFVDCYLLAVLLYQQFFDCLSIHVFVGVRTLTSDGGETFLWQLQDTSNITIGNKEYRMTVDDVLLIPVDTSFQLTSSKEGITLSCKMNVNNRFRA